MIVTSSPLQIARLLRSSLLGGTRIAAVGLVWIAPIRPCVTTFLYLAAPKMRAKRSKPVASVFLEGVEATNGSA
jgi:hypothetical protein